MPSFRLDWPPTVNTYWRHRFINGMPRVYVTQKGQKYRETSVLQLMEQDVVRGIKDRVSVMVNAYPPDHRRRDIDNILKVVLDCLQEYGVFEDDEQIDILTVRRRTVSKPGYVEIQVEVIDPDDSLC